MTDLRYACRMFARNPGFTAVAVLTLVLGIGANSAIFSVVNAVLLRPLPYADPDALVMLWEHNFPRDRPTNVVSPANYLAWKDSSRSFTDMVAIGTSDDNLTGAGDPVKLSAHTLNGDLFGLLGVGAALGRTFTDDEYAPGGEPVVVVSHDLWHTRFGGDPDLVGRAVVLDGRPWTVVGVMPDGFGLLDERIDLWKAMPFDASARTPEGRWLRVVARLAPGVSLTQTRAEMTAIAQRLVERFPDFNTGWGVNVVPLHEQMVGAVKPALLVLLGAVGCVLLIACANVAHLLLARSATRRHELAVRAALGASRARLVRQLLVESLLLAGLGGLIAVGLAAWGTDAIIALAGERAPIPRTAEVELDTTVVAFTLVVTLLTGLLFGLAPAWTVSRAPLEGVMRQASRGAGEARSSRRLRNSLIVAEVALALMLLVAAGLMLKSFRGLLEQEPGFRPQQVLTLKVSLPTSRYPEGHQRVAFFEQLLARLEGLPGVRAAGANPWLPLDGMGAATSFTVDGRPEPPAGQRPVTDVRFVTGRYFSAMGIPLLRGRLFDGLDGEDGRRVLIVSEAMVRQLFPDEDPLGKRLHISWNGEGPDEIVGVVGDVKHSGLDVEPRPMIYWPHRRDPFPFFTVAVRSDAAAAADLSAATIAEVHAMDPDLPVFGVRPMDDIVGASVAQPRLTMALLLVFAALAAVLAAIGIYGLLTYWVSQRTREIGIRIAIGADPQRVMRLVLGQSLALIGLGLGLGIAGAIALSRVLDSLLFEVSATDPATLVTVSGLMLAVGLVACYAPARRATRIDPAVALRAE